MQTPVAAGMLNSTWYMIEALPLASKQVAALNLSL